MSEAMSAVVAESGIVFKEPTKRKHKAPSKYYTNPEIRDCERRAKDEKIRKGGEAPYLCHTDRYDNEPLYCVRCRTADPIVPRILMITERDQKGVPIVGAIQEPVSDAQVEYVNNPDLAWERSVSYEAIRRGVASGFYSADIAAVDPFVIVFEDDVEEKT